MNKKSHTTEQSYRPNESIQTWNFTPSLPDTLAPYYNRPFNLINSVKYLFSTWRPSGLRFLLLLLAIACWVWFTPSLERAKEFQLDWMLEIGLRNLAIVLFVAGGLHLLLFTFRKQGDKEHYDARPLAKSSQVFHFGNQVWDNMFWTLASSVPIGTLWECVLLWCYANGYATLLTFNENPLWFIGLFIFIPIWSGLHFYWYHRLAHVQPLYRWFHSWHHKNINTGPWSGHAMHPVEHLFLYSDVLIYLIIASHPIHVIFNSMLHTVGGPTSHCNYHTVYIGRFFKIQLGDFMHQLHHRFFDCNYGTYETPWDKIFGSFHDGTTAGNELIKQRKIKLVRKQRQSARRK